MRLPRKFLKFDCSVQLLFGFSAGLMLMGFPYTIYLIIYLWMLLGMWQVLSALVLILGYKDRTRIYYLCSVIAYIAFLVVSNSNMRFYIPIMVLSAIALSIWYAYLTYKDATYRTPSFWDLEF